MKVIQKAKTTPKTFSKGKRNAAPTCNAVCKKCPPMTC